jgi:hypothetical protein
VQVRAAVVIWQKADDVLLGDIEHVSSFTISDGALHAEEHANDCEIFIPLVDDMVVCWHHTGERRSKEKKRVQHHIGSHEQHYRTEGWPERHGNTSLA